ncbi:FMN-linked oxidoreductase [Neurospora crassa]|uniref:Dihydroorotate dehydrogenase (fumarate) n=2 Tax=Neurospora crassa TaxID=5141 RepID=Q7S7L1_NEUCR|nr:dihydroorotate dehydrogenase [Neurospora crassa OR74A]EAA31728.2 dihydroorotate dehydrogenase [Neurospora crassa OR74A]KHE82088.1 FMN-linked oxidoreductase [Neurospora crassa]CAD71046.1 related to dihydroorotate dehydrogenase a [Neurospora crassa]|eukprot:XP_960964.2 dihydroorotate dehydrogenase [Neurospora crassa OR74A]
MTSTPTPSQNLTRTNITKMTIPKLNIHPPLINTPCPAATTLEDLLILWNCPSTGAITTRTSLLSGFPHDDTKNLYVFYDSSSHTVSSSTNPSPPSSATPTQNATLNSLGYSPLPLQTYLDFIRTIAVYHSPPPPPPNNHKGRSIGRSKTIIISVTGSAEDVAQCYLHIARLQSEFLYVTSSSSPSFVVKVAMEINLSCPNIPHHPPPAYSRDALVRYLEELKKAIKAAEAEGLPRIPVGLKTPPYTYETQFLGLMEALEASASATALASERNKKQEEKELQCPITFLTATNTLGSCLAFTAFTGFTDDFTQAALPTDLGTGGLAGAPLHPLALGNVKTLRKMLDEREKTLGHRIQIIGVGGVLDAQGYKRMRMAGADVVGLASGLLLRGVKVFEEIEKGVGGDW